MRFAAGGAGGKRGRAGRRVITHQGPVLSSVFSALLRYLVGVPLSLLLATFEVPEVINAEGRYRVDPQAFAHPGASAPRTAAGPSVGRERARTNKSAPQASETEEQRLPHRLSIVSQPSAWMQIE